MDLKKIELLTKTAWSLSDIAYYYDLSKQSASALKNEVEATYGCIEADKNKIRTRVKADNVIFTQGGIDAYHELKKIETLQNIKEREIKLKALTL